MAPDRDRDVERDPTHDPDGDRGVEARAGGDRALRRDAAENLTRILDVAPLVFAEQGWGASMDEIARRAGVGVGTIYRRFPRKEDLLDAVMADRMRLVQEWAQAASEEPDAWTGLVGFIERMIEMPAGVLAFRSVIQLRWSPDDAREFFESFAPLVAGLIERGQRAGQLRADLELSDLPMLIVGLDGVRMASEAIAPDLWRRFLGIHLDGLRAEPATALPVPGLTPAQIRMLMSGQSEADASVGGQAPSTT